MENFKELGIDEELAAILEGQGIVKPTPIQEGVIKHIKNKKDLIAQAHTGTGKTLAFLIPMFEKIDPSKNCVQGLIITPTRELAIQITQEANKINEFKKIKILATYGGQDVTAQLYKLQTSPHLIVATPGRLIDHIRRGSIFLNDLDVLVLDEADQMLRIGFRKEEYIVNQTPQSRQTLCFSATMNPGVNELAKKLMKSPEIIKVNHKRETLENIEQYLISTIEENKFTDLSSLVESDKPYMSIIFCKTQRRVDALEEKMRGSAYNCDKLHGGLSQGKRERVMTAFKNKKIKHLVATDVAARGLDISGVSHIYNYDMPENPQTYIHRIGRTGRAGKEGVSYLFVTKRDNEGLKDIERTIKMAIKEKKSKKVESTDNLPDHVFKGDEYLNPDGTRKDANDHRYKRKKKDDKKKVRTMSDKTKNRIKSGFKKVNEDGSAKHGMKNTKKKNTKGRKKKR